MPDGKRGYSAAAEEAACQGINQNYCFAETGREAKIPPAQ